MTRYAALLRGINLGQVRKVNMLALKQTFESAGCEDVRTYIQSGNVVFESSEDEAALTDRLVRHFEQDFGFAVPMTLRTSKEWAEVVAANPYPHRLDHLSVAFLSAVPASLDALKAVQCGEVGKAGGIEMVDVLGIEVVVGREARASVPRGIRDLDVQHAAGRESIRKYVDGRSDLDEMLQHVRQHDQVVDGLPRVPGHIQQAGLEAFEPITAHPRNAAGGSVEPGQRPEPPAAQRVQQPPSRAARVEHANRLAIGTDERCKSIRRIAQAPRVFGRVTSARRDGWVFVARVPRVIPVVVGLRCR